MDEKHPMFAVVIRRPGMSSWVKALFVEEPEAWDEVEDYRDGGIDAWVAVVEVTVGALVDIDSDEGKALAEAAIHEIYQRTAAMREP